LSRDCENCKHDGKELTFCRQCKAHHTKPNFEKRAWYTGYREEPEEVEADY
jgi:hypothetical protein